jgi:hypothetical protein
MVAWFATAYRRAHQSNQQKPTMKIRAKATGFSAAAAVAAALFIAGCAQDSTRSAGGETAEI